MLPCSTPSATVDPCSENDASHSFACAGPMFHAPIAVEIGATVERWVCVYRLVQEPRPGEVGAVSKLKDGACLNS